MISASDARARTNICKGDVRSNMMDELALQIDTQIREASGAGRASLAYIWPSHTRGVEKAKMVDTLRNHGYVIQSSPSRENSILIHW